MLNEEESSDRQLREQFKAQWTRTPSTNLTAPIRSEAEKYRTILNNAMAADKVIKQRFNEHVAGYELLSQSNVCLAGTDTCTHTYITQAHINTHQLHRHMQTYIAQAHINPH